MIGQPAANLPRLPDVYDDALAADIIAANTANPTIVDSVLAPRVGNATFYPSLGIVRPSTDQPRKAPGRASVPD